MGIKSVNLFFLTFVLMSVGLFLSSHFVYADTNLTAEEQALENRVAVAQKEIFSQLIKKAHELNCRVYLIGSSLQNLTASISQNLNSKPELTNHQIFQGGSDIDVFVQGSHRSYDKLRTWAASFYPDFKWDFGLIRPTERDLFSGQHSDSLSTTMIELTDDLKEWHFIELRKSAAYKSHFLHDFIAGQIHFYYDPQHYQSGWAQKGKNPAIFAALRYLIHLKKHNFSPAEQADIENVNRIISEFNPLAELTSEYAIRRFNYLVFKLNTLTYLSKTNVSQNFYLDLFMSKVENYRKTEYLSRMVQCRSFYH